MRAQVTKQALGADAGAANQRPPIPCRAGHIVAFVGPQATGKSTLLGAIAERYAGDGRIQFQHVGKPPVTFVTWLPRRLIPLVRALAPGKSTGNVERERAAEAPRSWPLLYLVNKILLGWDRRALLRRLARSRRRGLIVLCDRYPGDNTGAIDGPSFGPEAVATERSPLKRWLMRREAALYRGLPAADLVFELHVPVEVAVERHRTRNKPGTETDDYIRFRHAAAVRPEFPRSRCIRLDTSESLARTQAVVFATLEGLR